MLSKHLSSHPIFSSQDEVSPPHSHTLLTTFSQESLLEYHLEMCGYRREQSVLNRSLWACRRPGEAEALRLGLSLLLRSRTTPVLLDIIGKSTDFGIKLTKVQIPALPLTSFLTLSR